MIEPYMKNVCFPELDAKFLVDSFHATFLICPNWVLFTTITKFNEVFSFENQKFRIGM